MTRSPNIITYFCPTFERVIQVQLPVYPSAKIGVSSDRYMEVAKWISDEKIPCIFFDGEAIFVPEYEKQLIERLSKDYGATVELGRMKDGEFATLAVKAGLDGYLIKLGHAVQRCGLSPTEMLCFALNNPAAEVKRQWGELYLSSMNPQ